MTKINFGYYLTFCSLFITLSLFVLSKHDITIITSNTLRTITQVCALLGTVLLCISYLLATRTKLIESLFGGLDKVYKAHHLISGLAYLLLLYHPLILIIKALPNLKQASKYILLSGSLSYDLGILAFGFLTFLLILTLFINLPYHLWKKTHEYIGIVVLLALFHVFLIDSDVSNYSPLRVFMLSWLLLGLSAFIYRRFLYRFLRDKYSYQITSLNQTGAYLLLTLTPLGKPLPYQPGQFAFFSFLRNLEISQESHPYSFVSHPSEPALRLGIKASGDHTNALHHLKDGDLVDVSSAFGQFGSRLYANKPVILIGAGIGITPIISLSHEAASKRTVETSVYYVTDTLENAPFDPELNSLCQSHPLLKYHKINTKTDGRLGITKLQENHPNLTDCLVFICGPTAMMTTLEGQLVDSGLKHSQIIYEDFSFK